MKKTVIAIIGSEQHAYTLIGRRGDWNWRCPGGERAGEAAGGATKDAAFANLYVNLENDEPDFESLEWE